MGLKPRRLKKPVRCYTSYCREGIAVELTVMRGLCWQQRTVTMEGCQG